MNRLAGKVALVTGANQGIGKGIAKAFAAEGAHVAICARNAEKLTSTVAELTAAGADVFATALDVTDEAAVKAWVEAAHTRFGRVDILVNNAGAFDGGRLDNISLAAWNNVIGACMTGTFLCSRAVFPLMKEQGGGRIINIGSISAQRPREGGVPYAAAKFGVWGMTQAIALDGRPFGISCSCLHPGNVLVERRAETELKSDAEPMMSVETISEVAVTMASLPAHVNMLEAIVLPVGQDYLGRG
ncbi:MAG: short-chain dehydrogenase/reductase [Planctomycetaceae bacterium]|nr:short-chain dehydrogenase/reductase [Planctomycetaceae bacterium]